jgi:hypothetical protein
MLLNRDVICLLLFVRWLELQGRVFTGYRIIWEYDNMIIWEYDNMRIWEYDNMIIWEYDNMRIW